MTDKSVISKLKKEGKSFEILVHPEQAHAFLHGKPIPLQQVLVAEEIFEDVKKGTRASEHDMERIFGTSNKLEIAKRILHEGHVPQTEEMLRKEAEQRKKQVIDLIHRNVIDPNTKRPHPPGRIETALSDAKVRIDPSKTAEAQLQDVVKALAEHLPLKIEAHKILLKIPVKYAGRVLPLLKKSVKLVQQNWEQDGSLTATLEVPAGIQEELEHSLNSITKGNMELKVIGET